MLLCGNQAPAAGFGKTGFDAAGPDLPQQPVVIGPCPAGNRDLFGGCYPGKNRIFHGKGRNLSQFQSSRIVRLAIQTTGIFEMCMPKAQRLCFFIHFLNKALFPFRVKAGQRRCRIVAAFQQQSVQQIRYRQLLPRPQIDGRSLNAAPFLTDCDRFLQIILLQSHQGGHDLCGTGHSPRLRGLFLIQHRSVQRVIQNCALCADRRLRKRRYRYRKKKKCRKECQNSSFYQDNHLPVYHTGR